MPARAYLQLNVKAFEKNCKTLLQKAGDGFFCPVVKANAYGHGALEVVKILQNIGVKKVGVISVKEALQLKELKLNTYVFGPLSPEDIKVVIDKKNIIPVVGRIKD